MAANMLIQSNGNFKPLHFLRNLTLESVWKAYGRSLQLPAYTLSPCPERGTRFSASRRPGHSVVLIHLTYGNPNLMYFSKMQPLSQGPAGAHFGASNLDMDFLLM